MPIYVKYNLEEKELCKYYSFEEVKNYDQIIHIYCGYNQLTSLPKLPNSLEYLWCNYNQLTVLPELPNSLKKLLCYNNQLTSLPELPNSLKRLECNNNKLMKKRKYKYLIKIIYL